MPARVENIDHEMLCKFLLSKPVFFSWRMLAFSFGVVQFSNAYSNPKIIFSSLRSAQATFKMREFRKVHPSEPPTYPNSANHRTKQDWLVTMALLPKEIH